jgi:hypothetical protein
VLALKIEPCHMAAFTELGERTASGSRADVSYTVESGLFGARISGEATV